MSACHCGACGRAFSGVGQFDLHRSAEGEHGACIDPATILKKNGQPAMEFRNGKWCGAEMSEKAKAKLRELGESKADKST